jgi:hypothetical protein
MLTNQEFIKSLLFASGGEVNIRPRKIDVLYKDGLITEKEYKENRKNIFQASRI